MAVSRLAGPWVGLAWSSAPVAALLVLGVAGTGLAYAVWFWLLGRASLLQLGTALFPVPVVGVVAGILTGDRPSPADLAGIAAVLAGMGVISLSPSASAVAKAAD